MDPGDLPSEAWRMERLSAVRTELLGQHAGIRAEPEEMRRTLGEPTGEPAAQGRPQASVARLADLVRRHNAREEELMRDILRTLDAWGAVRTAIMREQHHHEHEELYMALVSAGAAPDEHALLARLHDKLLAHMAHEEKIFLNEDLLTDEAVVQDYFGG